MPKTTSILSGFILVNKACQVKNSLCWKCQMFSCISLIFSEVSGKKLIQVKFILYQYLSLYHKHFIVYWFQNLKVNKFVLSAINFLMTGNISYIKEFDFKHYHACYLIKVRKNSCIIWHLYYSYIAEEDKPRIPERFV